MKIIGANITGSFILNNQDVTTTIQTSNVWSGSAASSITALNATTASLLNYTASNNASITDLLLETASINLVTASLLSYTASQNSRNGTYATTGSNTFAGIQTVNSNLVVTGSITAQTLVVQTVTSSVSFMTGSTKFGSLAANTHQFTGSVIITGSLNATAFTGSGAGLTSIPNGALTNSTISGISLGSNLATLTIGTGLSGTSYNGSTGVTIANSGVTSIVAGTGISINQGTGAVTVTNTINNTNQLTNGAGYITSAGTAAAVSQTVSAGSTANLVYATVGDNDFIRILAGGASNAGYLEIATADDGTEPIYVRQYTGTFTSLTRTATLLDGSGNTSFPGTVSATFSGNLTGNVTGNCSGTSNNITAYTINQSVGTSDSPSFNQVFSSNNGNGTNYRVGDDAWFGDVNAANTVRLKGVQDSNAGYLTFGNQSTALGLNNSTTLTWGAAFTATGDVTAFSDVRVKENIKTIDNALNKVLCLRGVTFNRIDLDDKSEKMGVIAQEIQEIIPQVVMEENDRLSVAYGNLAGLFIEAIKEQQTQIEELKSIINGLTK